MNTSLPVMLDFDVKGGKVVVAGDGTKKVSVISIMDIARYVPEILLDPSTQEECDCEDCR